MASLNFYIDKQIAEIIEIIKEISIDERIPLAVRGEYMDKIAGSIKGKTNGKSSH